VLRSVLQGQLLAEQYGTGAPRVLALHGWARTRLDWNAALADLDAIAVDLPGFGVTAPPPEAWGSQDYADYLLPLIGELDQPVLVGHSFGGRVAAHIAATVPDQVAGLVLTGVPLMRLESHRKPAAKFRTLRRLHRMRLLSEARMDRARERYGSPDYRAATGVMRQTFVRLVNEDYTETLRAIGETEVPVRLVWGEHDSEVPRAVADAIRDRIRRAEIEVVAGSGHLLDAALSARVAAAAADLVQRREDLRPLR
jgi:pimeloyl-ACP methyl ester carboxylesterase